MKWMKRLERRLGTVDPIVLWTTAGLGVAALGFIGYGVVSLLDSGWPAEGDECSIEIYREILGAHTNNDAAIERAWRYMPLSRHAAHYLGVDPSLLAGLVHTESAWVPNAGSGAGAVGLSQHIASTAAATFKKLAQQNRWPFTKLSSSNDPARNGKLAELGAAQWVDRTDPRQSLWLGAGTLRSLLDVGKGTEWALAAYNGGPKVANSPKSQWPQETQNYVPGVLERASWYAELEDRCRGLFA